MRCDATTPASSSRCPPGVAGTPVDPEELRYAPRAPRRFAWLRRIVVLAVIGVLLWLGGSTAYAWTQKQYYVAPDGDTVAIFRGVQAQVPVLSLHRVYQPSEVQLSDLPDFTQRQVRDGIGARNLEDARNIVARLETSADCTDRRAGLAHAVSHADQETDQEAVGQREQEPRLGEPRPPAPPPARAPPTTATPHHDQRRQ